MAILNINIGESQDWKFGLVTREISRVDNFNYEIIDTSNGWITSKVNVVELLELIRGEKQLSELVWD